MFCTIDIDLLNDVYNERLKELKHGRYYYTFKEYNPHMLAISARRWILDKAISKCMDNLQKDPFDILNEMQIELELIKMQVSTKDAKVVYSNAIKEIVDIIGEINYKLYRRGK